MHSLPAEIVPLFQASTCLRCSIYCFSFFWLPLSSQSCAVLGWAPPECSLWKRRWSRSWTTRTVRMSPVMREHLWCLQRALQYLPTRMVCKPQKQGKHRHIGYVRSLLGCEEVGYEGKCSPFTPSVPLSSLASRIGFSLCYCCPWPAAVMPVSISSAVTFSPLLLLIDTPPLSFLLVKIQAFNQDLMYRWLLQDILSSIFVLPEVLEKNLVLPLVKQHDKASTVLLWEQELLGLILP